MISESLKRFNERVAVSVVNAVSTMWCAYAFLFLSVLSLPDAVHTTFENGFHLLPMVSWVSTVFLQLVLLSIIMVGQDVQARGLQERNTQQYDAVMESLALIRDDHACTQEVLREGQEILRDVQILLQAMGK